jgi:plasmid stabilization system protein ParE
MPVAIWTPKAELDLEEILYYIRVTAGRPLTAQRIGQEIVTVAERQAPFSASGPRHPATPSEWRYVRHKRWLIFYQPHPQGIEVMRVLDGSRDLPRTLSELP